METEDSTSWRQKMKEHEQSFLESGIKNSFQERELRYTLLSQLRDSHVIWLVVFQCCSVPVTMSTYCFPLQRVMFDAEILSLFCHCRVIQWGKIPSFFVCFSSLVKRIKRSRIGTHWRHFYESLRAWWYTKWDLGYLMERRWELASFIWKRKGWL